ncbi:MAG: SPOR domain-containing protein, partial [Chitinophagaceae bacterium]
PFTIHSSLITHSPFPPEFGRILVHQNSRRIFNMMRLLLFLFAFTTINAYAQSDSGTVTVQKDPRISLLVKKQAQINEETTRLNRRSMPGFRLQVINTIDRGDAIIAKTKIYQLYPELKAYLQYKSPYYRLKVGNFKSRQEAEDYQKSLSGEFQNTVFIVRDIIEVRPEVEIVDN